MVASSLSAGNPSLCYTDVKLYFDGMQVCRIVVGMETHLKIVREVERAIVRYDGVVNLEVSKREEVTG